MSPQSQAASPQPSTEGHRDWFRSKKKDPAIHCNSQGLCGTLQTDHMGEPLSHRPHHLVLTWTELTKCTQPLPGKSSGLLLAHSHSVGKDTKILTQGHTSQKLQTQMMGWGSGQVCHLYPTQEHKGCNEGSLRIILCTYLFRGLYTCMSLSFL